MFQQLIVGFGRAGRDLHLRCLLKARERPEGRGLFEERIGIVDPLAAGGRALLGAAGLPTYATIADARREFDPRCAVVHVCTGPAEHYPVLAEAAAAGFRRFVVEKPMTDDPSEVEQILALERDAGVVIAVVSNWLSSPVTARLASIIASGELGALERMVIEQSKPRLSRTLANGSHHTAFDVEIPHQVALALALGGMEVAVVDAESTDLASPSGTVPHMGSATIVTRHGDRVIGVCRSDLGCPFRKREAVLEFEQGVAIGYFQTGADDDHAWVELFGDDGRLIAAEVYEDDPLSTCFIEYYRHFAGRGPEPRSNVAFNAAVVSLIARSKALCGLPSPAGVRDDVRRGMGPRRPRVIPNGSDLATSAARLIRPLHAASWQAGRGRYA